MYVYKTTNLINGKIYIGLTSKSLNESLDYYGSGINITYALKKYGKENFTKEIIEHCDTMDDLYRIERYWISHYNSTDPTIGYNISDGGNNFKSNPNKDEVFKNMSEGQLKRYAENPMVMSEEHRLAIKKARNASESKAKTSKVHKGKKRSQEWKDKISNSRKGQTLSDEHKLKIANTLKSRPKIRDTRECPTCSTTFKVAPSSPKKYCSVSCARKQKRKRSQK